MSEKITAGEMELEAAELKEAVADRQLAQMGTYLPPRANINPMMQAFMPTQSEEAHKLADWMANSSMVPQEFRGKPVDIYLVMARAASVGVDWSNALSSMHVVKGRVGFSANLIAAICATSPEFEVFDVLESTDTYCTIEAKKKVWDAPRQYTATIEQAKQAGFRSERWQKQPRVMLQNMAKREAGRLWNPAGLMGIYEPEELEQGIIDVEATVLSIEPDRSRRVQHGEEAPVVQQKAETKAQALVRDKKREKAAEAGQEAVEALTEEPLEDPVKRKAAELADARADEERTEAAAEKKKASAEKRKATLARKKAEKEEAAIEERKSRDAARETAPEEEPSDDEAADLDFLPPFEEPDPDALVSTEQVNQLVTTMRGYNLSLPEGQRDPARTVWGTFLAYIETTFGAKNHASIPAARFDIVLETLEVMIQEAKEEDDG